MTRLTHVSHIYVCKSWPLKIDAYNQTLNSLRFHMTIILLCFVLLTRPKMPFKVMHRKEVTHSNGSYERKSRGRKLADEMGRAKKNSHGVLQSGAPEESDL